MTACAAIALDLGQWDAPPADEELVLLDSVAGPVIDIGCGPGRLVASLTHRGVAAVGVDISLSAVGLARRRGARVLHRDVFDRLPDEGTWATALLFDGTIGIGGNPTRLLCRCAELLAPSGHVIAEVGGPGTGWQPLTAWVERHGRQHGDPFPWATVGLEAVIEAARGTGFTTVAVERLPSDRWFVILAAPAG